MTTVLTRNAEGRVDLCDGSSVTVPTGFSALGTLGNNEFANGDDFRDDYWVYRDGKKHHKWFTSSREIKRFWPPRLADLNRIESLYWRYDARMGYAWDKLPSKIVDYISRGIDEADFVDASGWRCRYSFYVASGRYPGPTYATGGLQKGDLKNTDIGSEFRAVDRYYYDVCCRLSKAKRHLDEALKLKIGEPKREDTVFRVDVNGRTYFYRSYAGPYGTLHLAKLVWPGDDMVNVTAEG